MVQGPPTLNGLMFYYYYYYLLYCTQVSTLMGTEIYFFILIELIGLANQPFVVVVVQKRVIIFQPLTWLLLICCLLILKIFLVLIPDSEHGKSFDVERGKRMAFPHMQQNIAYSNISAYV